MKIEVLYFEGCPNYRPAMDRLRTVLRQEGLSPDVSEVVVRDERAARALDFIGSPTIRINGRNVEVECREVKEVAFACRRYQDGAPSEEMIRSALKEVQKGVHRA